MKTMHAKEIEQKDEMLAQERADKDKERAEKEQERAEKDKALAALAAQAEELERLRAQVEPAASEGVPP
eukprot:COSAG04_NODE_6628_length_1289_cov_1.384874_1_plen_69_part_00